VSFKPILFVSAIALTSFSEATRADTTNKFTISGGQVVELAVSERGAMPALADGVRVEVAGPIFGPSKNNPEKIALIWAFTLSIPKEAKYLSLTVENVTNAEAKLIASQDQPSVRTLRAPDGKELHLLELRGSPRDISPESTPWVYQDGTTTMIFRFALKRANENDITLQQLAIFGPELKAKIQKMALTASS
jgi:hypothetical protein